MSKTFIISKSARILLQFGKKKQPRKDHPFPRGSCDSVSVIT